MLLGQRFLGRLLVRNPILRSGLRGLVNFAVAPRGETATSSASISTAVRLPPSSNPRCGSGSARADDSADAGPQAQKQTLYKRCAVSGLRMGVTYVFLRVWCDTFILIKTRGRSSVGRAPALQVDKRKRCALVRFRRWAMSAEARIIRSSPRAQNRLRGPIGLLPG